jgi:hypothetical protein
VMNALSLYIILFHNFHRVAVYEQSTDMAAVEYY